ncbi:MAG: hypothetical protein WAV32_02670 [Halobacteriota archaeon]
MLSIVTTTTTTTVVTLGQAALFGAIGVIVLIAYLIAKELLSASGNKKAVLLGKETSAVIYPLLFAFLTIVAVEVCVLL